MIPLELEMTCKFVKVLNILEGGEELIFHDVEDWCMRSMGCCVDLHGLVVFWVLLQLNF